MTNRRPVVGVMGSGVDPHVEKCRELGPALADLGVHLLTGGGGGVMAEISRAFSQAPEREGRVIGVLPCADVSTPKRLPPGYPNRWVEIPIATHLAARGAQGGDVDSRNHINVLSSDAVVVLPGGAGTASEAALAIQYGRPVVAFLDRQDDVPGLPRDLRVVDSAARVVAFLVSALRDWPDR